MLPSEVWFIIVTFLGPFDIFNLSMCSKGFYKIVHQNKKYKKIFIHSRKIVGGVNLNETFVARTRDFF